MLALGGFVLLDARRDAWAQAEHSSQNLLLALERDIERNFAVYDLSLQGVMDALAEPGIDEVSPGIRHEALFDRAASAENLGAILVLDAAGTIVEDSTSVVPHRLNLADREHFRVHVDNPDAGLFVSRAYRSRLVQGDLRMSISRRRPSADGSFNGVVAGSLRLNYFRQLFEKIELGIDGSISLLRDDGRMLVRFPFREQDVDRDVTGSDTFRHFSSRRSGQFVSNGGAIDGIERLYSFTRIGDLPLILSVNRSVDDIFAAWRQKAIMLGAILGLLCACMALLSLLFRREMVRRTAAEQALTAAVDELAVMAATDPLTGLANRRSFDTAFDREWLRAMRAGSRLSVVLIDVDWFKPFNDRYGHQSGDEALRAVANCIRTALRRPADLGARYGGEEFVALLPDVPAAGALAMAERIRGAVAALELTHAGSPYGRVTVSIGVVTAARLRDDGQAALLAAADEALYAAKRAGRNRVSVSDRLARPFDRSAAADAA